MSTSWAIGSDHVGGAVPQRLETAYSGRPARFGVRGLAAVVALAVGGALIDGWASLRQRKSGTAESSVEQVEGGI